MYRIEIMDYSSRSALTHHGAHLAFFESRLSDHHPYHFLGIMAVHAAYDRPRMLYGLTDRVTAGLIPHPPNSSASVKLSSRRHEQDAAIAAGVTAPLYPRKD
jgi:hypothetical protein